MGRSIPKGKPVYARSGKGQDRGIAVDSCLLFFACGETQRIVIFHLGLGRTLNQRIRNKKGGLMAAFLNFLLFTIFALAEY
jgi:hypothetical protein